MLAPDRAQAEPAGHPGGAAPRRLARDDGSGAQPVAAPAGELRVAVPAATDLAPILRALVDASTVTHFERLEPSLQEIYLRAIGADSRVDVALCTFSLTEGDSLVLAGRRLNSAEIAAGAGGEQVLVVRFAPEAARVARPREARNLRAAVTTGLATVLFYALLCLR